MYYIGIGIIIGLFISSDIFDNSKQIIKNSYSKCLKLKNIKSQFNISISLNLIKITISLLLQALWYYILQKINNNVVKITKNHYQVTFAIGGKVYKAIVEHNSSPSSVLQVIDSHSNDITDAIEPFLFFRKEDVTPALLGFDDITVIDITGETKEIKKFEKINISDDS